MSKATATALPHYLHQNLYIRPLKGLRKPYKQMLFARLAMKIIDAVICILHVELSIISLDFFIYTESGTRFILYLSYKY